MTKIKEFLARYKNSIFSYIALFFVMLILRRAKVVDVLSPFAFAFAFALISLGKNGIIVGLSFFAANMIFYPTFEGFIIGICTFSCIILCVMVYKIIKMPVKIYGAMIFAAISQAGYIYYNIASSEAIIASIVSVLVGLIFIYIYYICFGAIFYRFLQSKFTADEKVCFSLFLITLFSGLAEIYIYDANISVALIALIILLVSRCFTKNATLYVAALCGIGSAFYSTSLISEAIYVSFALIAASLADTKRIYPSILVLLCDALFGVFFGVYAVYNIFSIMPLLLALIIFIALPEKWIRKVKGLSFKYDGSIISDFLITGERELIKSRLLTISGLFKQMQSEYLSLSIGEADRNSAIEIMAEEIVSSFCSGCRNREICRQNKNIKASLIKLFHIGVERGKVTMLDASNLLSGMCICLSALLSEVNASLNMYFEYEKTIKSSDQGKLLASEQLGGTAEIFKELSRVCLSSHNLNRKKSKEILDELAYQKVIASECAVLEDQSGVKEIILVVRNADALSPAIESSLKSAMNIHFSVKERKMSRLSGWTIISFVPADKYKLTIGFSSNSVDKMGVSGDTKSVIKISDSKYLFAISDGMGHGERANKIATSALSLIENFYKAGFTSETIISSVNKIFLPSGEDNFVTLDAAIVDTSEGICDFIKIGASVSVIKSASEIKTVFAESLPLGITSVISPTIESRVLKEGDIIVLASDGVVDSFSRVEDYTNFVNNEGVISLQMLADNILEEAECRSVHKDDKTVITIKVNALI